MMKKNSNNEVRLVILKLLDFIISFFSITIGILCFIFFTGLFISSLSTRSMVKEYINQQYSLDKYIDLLGLPVDVFYAGELIQIDLLSSQLSTDNTLFIFEHGDFYSFNLYIVVNVNSKEVIEAVIK